MSESVAPSVPAVAVAPVEPVEPVLPVGAVPLVGVVMGSDSDWPVMAAAAAVLSEFGVAHEVDVVSAHRMPRAMLDYAADAAGRGVRVLIAGAGGAAHLPGMLAAATPLPVIGVPVPLATLDGLDSLLSIVQMPAGVPVATVSIGGARNAGLLAVRILAAADTPVGDSLRSRLVDFAAELESTARSKGARLRAAVAHAGEQVAGSGAAASGATGSVTAGLGSEAEPATTPSPVEWRSTGRSSR